jgi:hypothetical protein
MIETRTIEQVQQQVREAARQGRERLAVTAKTLTATAQLIRPQLPALGRPDLARQLQQIRELGPVLAARLPSPEQVKAGAQEAAQSLVATQRTLARQARAVAVPLARQAAARLMRDGSLPEQAARDHLSSNAVHPDSVHAANAHGEMAGAGASEATNGRTGSASPAPRAGTARKTPDKPASK